MLVLTRHVGERIRIGKDIEIVVLRLTGTRVQIGIDAPVTTRVTRGELDRKEQPS